MKKSLLIPAALLSLISSLAIASDLDTSETCNFVKLKQEFAQNNITNINLESPGVRARFAANHWILRETFLANVQSSQQVIKSEAVGIAFLSAMDGIEAKSYLADCITMGQEKNENQNRFFPGVTIIPSSPSEVTPYIIIKESNSPLVLLRTAQSNYVINLNNLKFKEYSAEKKQYVDVDLNSTRWLSRIFFQHEAQLKK